MKNKKLIFTLPSLLFAIFLTTTTAANAKLSISSTDMKEGQKLNMAQVFNDFGCVGENKSPQISINNIPAKAKSLAITLYDPDAPTGSGWWHWVVYNIPANITEIKSGDKKISAAASFGKNDFGKNEYGGACTPIGNGKHKYILTVYALYSEKLDIPKDASAALIGFNINASMIEKASITSWFERKK